MKKAFSYCLLLLLLWSCNNEGTKSETAGTDTTMKADLDLPFKALYSSNFTDDVSDADLITVMNSYKDWADGNMSGVEASLADSVEYTASSGRTKTFSRAELTSLWKTFRDSLSSVKIEMYAWRKMYAADLKESNVVTWYKEVSTYKDGRVDSAMYHDINGVKNGKIEWYNSMRRPYVK